MTMMRKRKRRNIRKDVPCSTSNLRHNTERQRSFGHCEGDYLAQMSLPRPTHHVLPVGRTLQALAAHRWQAQAGRVINIKISSTNLYLRVLLRRKGGGRKAEGEHCGGEECVLRGNLVTGGTHRS
ncbi:hypothetical protein E2C01_092026 [Portunus trituberculatus]|uniref:Uncharacterized protein n=1 Tax=Portunus trituberculatus TaxID=210409 RepID=A0A5B7JJ27_PORTR|nr:hypothetical protein [Portunus trituberculatus]